MFHKASIAEIRVRSYWLIIAELNKKIKCNEIAKNMLPALSDKGKP